MSSITDKLKLETANSQTVRLWPEGTFYKAYERSAYLFVTRLRPYEVKRRYVDKATAPGRGKGILLLSLGGQARSLACRG